MLFFGVCFFSYILLNCLLVMFLEKFSTLFLSPKAKNCGFS